MLPTDARLLEGARASLSDLARSAPAEFKGKLQAIDTALSELQLRIDTDFYRRHYASGVELLEEGESLTGIKPTNASLVMQLDNCEMAAAAWQHIKELRVRLEAVVRKTAGDLPPTARATQYLERVVTWENEFYARHRPPPPTDISAPEERCTKANIERYLREKFPEWSNIEVMRIAALTGGFSKRTVMIDTRDDKCGTRSMVMRIELPTQFRFWDGDQIDQEFAVLNLVHQTNIPMAKPLWLEVDRRRLGNRFLVSEKGSGERAGNHLRMDDGGSPELIQDLIARLVQIHAAKVDPNDPWVAKAGLSRWVAHKTLTECTSDRMVDYTEHLARRQVRPSPITIRLMEWLRQNVPVSDERPSMIHGDFGLHNVLTQEKKVSCILDWEYLVFSDPAEDLVPLIDQLAGVMSQEEVLALYVELGGRPVSEYRLRYWDVVFRLKFILTCENALRMFNDHPEADLGLCVLGFNYAYAGLESVNKKIARAEELKAM
ncbi:MAG TPA: phosphotransferase family protein [Steroidobacteraceae bacterium]